MIATDEKIAASAGVLDAKSYRRILARFAPKVIETEGENEAALANIESLLRKGEARLSPEEDAMLELLVSLVEKYEERVYGFPEGDPV
ncbi:MAG TPA: hypothetical protein VNH18_15285, partial [Bryobacteraceae bacterium]|nr:hypothetical protein [Bryobacteraceae bacterium]